MAWDIEVRIERLAIENFRGIKSLEWRLPRDQRLVLLIGPGDSGKSTILEAIHYLLGDRWNLAISDTDFFAADVSQPIVIRAVLMDVPGALRKDNSFGLWLSGLDAHGVLHQDPEDDHSPVLIASLTVDASLEPKWSIERVDGQSQVLTSSQRRHFSTFKVDDRIDAQLRWSRTSALGRMSASDGGERDALAAASRAAQEALASHGNASLIELASKIQQRANEIGGGRFRGIRPGLDTSRSSMGAGLALYEDAVPLTSFGLGSRRLASIAVQQLAAGTRSVVVIDEIEAGLEPHRAVRLLEYLKSSDEYSQVIATTHSAVVVEQASIENLATVTPSDGAVVVSSLGGAREVLERLRRARPSSLLARRVVVTEGATEYGLLLEHVKHWDERRAAAGLSTSAGEGVAIQHGVGGGDVPLFAVALHELGFEVTGLMDNDDRRTDAAVASAEARGITITRWEAGKNTESQVCANLAADQLSQLLDLAVELRRSEQTVLDDLNAVNSSTPVSSLNVAEWLEAGVPLAIARGLVSRAAIGRKWFKRVGEGRALGRWILGRRTAPELNELTGRLEIVRDFIYGPTAPVVVGGDAHDDRPRAGDVPTDG